MKDRIQKGAGAGLKAVVEGPSNDAKRYRLALSRLAREAPVSTFMISRETSLLQSFLMF